jgi:hypothetical protein
VDEPDVLSAFATRGAGGGGPDPFDDLRGEPPKERRHRDLLGHGASVSYGAVLTSEGVEPRRCGYVPQTPQVDTFTLVFVLRTAPGFDGTALEGLRLPDERLHLWQDDADPTVVRGSIENSADDLDGALAHGRELADELAAASPFDLAVEEVAAMDDERQLVWRARP